ncbi:hypothetical protein [Yinghuangia soli]|uniref:CBM2 domain-containing protein n=1 Tax=Yinghuangia soli TaxID=2908204 RepID=A0AA41Q7W6_9ACTN|nr:hypothetical protein [Yinghuangia soli]MCF2532841.1 hypothetical protein [Yinghuangia soli]
MPLAAAAVVCLLATSGVWLFSGSGEDKPTRPIGLDVPVTVPAPDMSSRIPATPDTGAASPTGASASPTAVPTTAAPRTSAPRPTTKPPTQPPATTRPPSPTVPATTAPPPPVPYAVTGAASGNRSREVLTLTVSVANPNTVPLARWSLVLEVGDGWVYDWESSNRSLARASYGGAESQGQQMGGQQQVQLTFWIEYDRSDWPSSISYTFNGARTTVPVG